MTHLDDGALLRIIDGDRLPESADEQREHLCGCEECRIRLDEIRDTLSAVSEAITRTDIVVPKKRPMKWSLFPLGAAASILLAITVFFTPLRAWVIERASDLWRAGVDVEPPPAALLPEPPALEPTIGSVSFIPVKEVFVLEVTGRQEMGTLAIEIGGLRTATATINGTIESETLLVLPDGLRIVNSPASRTTYTVLLPVSISRVELVVANDATVILEPSDRQRRWEISVGQR